MFVFKLNTNVSMTHIWVFFGIDLPSMHFQGSERFICWKVTIKTDHLPRNVERGRGARKMLESAV